MNDPIIPISDRLAIGKPCTTGSLDGSTLEEIIGTIVRIMPMHSVLVECSHLHDGRETFIEVPWERVLKWLEETRPDPRDSGEYVAGAVCDNCGGESPRVRICGECEIGERWSKETEELRTKWRALAYAIGVPASVPDEHLQEAALDELKVQRKTITLPQRQAYERQENAIHVMLNEHGCDREGNIVQRVRKALLQHATAHEEFLRASEEHGRIHELLDREQHSRDGTLFDRVLRNVNRANMAKSARAETLNKLEAAEYSVRELERRLKEAQQGIIDCGGGDTIYDGFRAGEHRTGKSEVGTLVREWSAAFTRMGKALGLIGSFPVQFGYEQIEREVSLKLQLIEEKQCALEDKQGSLQMLDIVFKRIGHALGLEGEYPVQYGYRKIEEALAEKLELLKAATSEAGIEASSDVEKHLHALVFQGLSNDCTLWAKVKPWTEEQMSRSLAHAHSMHRASQDRGRGPSATLVLASNLINETLRARYMERFHAAESARWVRRIKEVEGNVMDAHRALEGSLRSEHRK